MTSSEGDPVNTLSMHQSYLGNQRWFAGKGRGFEVRAVHRMAWLSPPPGSDVWPVTRVELVEVSYHDGDVETYQVPVAYYPQREDRLAHAYIAEVDEPELGQGFGYDPLHYGWPLFFWLHENTTTTPLPTPGSTGWRPRTSSLRNRRWSLPVSNPTPPWSS